ncbi:uncharacterized protein LOC133073111 [Dama dama]|uniref:uncharacterized protein LOC133073111 n=1 Tax=Dama dama TaxID=30532 RepID=UPI002A37160F|nr:uncharacterized protein LOC133073111 [Dama dama]
MSRILTLALPEALGVLDTGQVQSLQTPPEGTRVQLPSSPPRRNDPEARLALGQRLLGPIVTPSCVHLPEEVQILRAADIRWGPEGLRAPWRLSGPGLRFQGAPQSLRRRSLSHPRRAGSGGHGSCKLQSSKYRGEPESAERTSNRDHRAGLCLHAGWTRPPHVGRTVCCSQATDSSVHPGTPSPTHPAYHPSVRAPAIQPSSSVKSNTSLGGGGPVSVSGGAWASPSACPLPDPASRTSLTTGSFQPRGRPSLSIGYRPWQPESFHPWSQFLGHLLVLALPLTGLLTAVRCLCARGRAPQPPGDGARRSKGRGLDPSVQAAPLSPLAA